MLKIYVNGKRVTKEDLSKIEIRSEEIEKILANKISYARKKEKVAG